MLVLKLLVVPLFIAAITIAGRRWGASVAGLLSGFPVVAGPIVVFVALEQGTTFGANAARASIGAIAALLVYGIAYSWACTKWSWLVSLLCSLLAWCIAAAGLVLLPNQLAASVTVAVMALVLTPWLLPRGAPTQLSKKGLEDLPYRMITSALLTLGVTGAAASLGEVLSGILAVFPIISIVLSVFTHRSEGASQVTNIYRGMVNGLYSFAIFFLVLSLLWTHFWFWGALFIATTTGVLTQAIVQWLVAINKSTKRTPLKPNVG